MISILKCFPGLASRLKIMLLFTFVLFNLNSFSQSLPVGLLDNIEDAYRRSQLLGLDTSGISYMIRPLNMSTANTQFLQTGPAPVSLSDFRKKLYGSYKEKVALYVLPVVLQQQFNSHHPYGMNDGSMIPAKGYQTQLSLGVYAKIGPLSIQLRPELVSATNAYFTQTYERANGLSFAAAYKTFSNRIDRPERFGSGNHTNLNWGQSSVRLTFNPVSVGLSNENLWWGPGFRNSVLMTNNAAGFKHLTLNTSRPIYTYIGSFEAQLIAGRLDPSGIEIPSLPGYTQKPKDWRYLSAIAVTWQPKWIPNLYLGFDRAFVMYRKDMERSFSGYFPILSPFEKSSFVSAVPGGPNAEDVRKSDQNFSLSARWVLPESKAEVYFQFGRNDHAWDLRDAVVEPEHSQAYVVGFRKLVPLVKGNNEFIEVGVEITQLQATSTNRLRAYPTWYAHHQVVAGYTNEGQVIGAGIGPGSNMQTLMVNWVSGFKRIGLTLERTIQNNDLYYDAFGSPSTADFRRHWVDLAFLGNFSWDFGNLVLNANAGMIHSLNYQYQFSNQSSTDIFVWDKADVNNFHLKVGLLYRW